MERLRSIDQLVDGATYELPTGQHVHAAQTAGGVVWTLRSPQERRVYGIVPAGTIYLISDADASSDHRRPAGDDGFAALTGWSVRNLRPVD
jgi:hypothetical protein